VEEREWTILIPPAIYEMQPAQERTIEEIKAEAQARAERGAYPLIGLDPADVREALATVKTRDRDEWAAAWSMVADRYYSAAAGSASVHEQRSNYLRAWRLYYFAQWPVPSSAGKKAAYAKALDAFARSAQALSPPLEVVRIPFEGKEIVGYLRLPSAAAKPVPVVLAVSGLDSRKENLAETYGALLERGVGFFAVDGPGTGHSPVRAGPTADRVLSRAIDYLVSRNDIDARRIVLHGVSFGGYWAAKLAIVEKDRLRAVVAQSPPIHGFFQPAFIKNSLLGNREYLFDAVPAFLDVVDNVETVDDLLRELPKMSLVALGLLGRPTTSMLVIAGAKDTQVPIADIDLLLHNGDVPKDAWINPNGGHLGRERSGWTDQSIFARVITPWELRVLTEDNGR
jgi:pimeloyl-ACP methyl ester carboxylesterase